MVKRMPTTQETWVQSLGREDPLEKEMATHSSTLAWKIPWIQEPGRLQSVGPQRVGHDWVTSPYLTLPNLLYYPTLISIHDYWKKYSFDYMDLFWQNDVSAFNILSRFVIAFLSRSKYLFISWLQSWSAVILEPKKIKSAVVFTFPPSYRCVLIKMSTWLAPRFERKLNGLKQIPLVSSRCLASRKLFNLTGSCSVCDIGSKECEWFILFFVNIY